MGQDAALRERVHFSLSANRWTRLMRPRSSPAARFRLLPQPCRDRNPYQA